MINHLLFTRCICSLNVNTTCNAMQKN